MKGKMVRGGKKDMHMMDGKPMKDDEMKKMMDKMKKGPRKGK